MVPQDTANISYHQPALVHLLEAKEGALLLFQSSCHVCFYDRGLQQGQALLSKMQ